MITYFIEHASAICEKCLMRLEYTYNEIKYDENYAVNYILCRCGNKVIVRPEYNDSLLNQGGD